MEIWCFMYSECSEASVCVFSVQLLHYAFCLLGFASLLKNGYPLLENVTTSVKTIDRSNLKGTGTGWCRS